MLSRLNKVSPAFSFLLTALILGGCYFFVRPPMQSPDEFNHFLRAYQVSEGCFAPVKKDQRLGGEMPCSFKEFMSIYMPSTFVQGYTITKKEISEGFKVPLNKTETMFMDFPNTSYYSFVSYIPQAFILAVLKQFNISVGALYHLSRLFVFLLWVLSMFFVIRSIPVGKWLLSLLLLLPMSVYLSVSYSADTVTNMLAFILFTRIIKLALEDKKVTLKALVFIVLTGIALVFAKTVYAGLLLLLFIIPAGKFASVRQKYVSIGAIMMLILVLTLFWSEQVMRYYITYADYNPQYRDFTTLLKGSDYYLQKEWMLGNKWLFVKVVFNSIVTEPGFYLISYIGHFGTYMDMPVPVWFAVLSYMAIVVVAVLDANSLRFSSVQRTTLLITALLIYSVLLLSLHLTWNSVGSESMNRLQGRYLVPLLPLVFLAFTSPFPHIKINPAGIALLFVLLSNAYTANMLYRHYFVETHTHQSAFGCDMETLTPDNQLKTSEPDIVLSGAEKRSSLQSRTGNYALVLPPDSSVAAEYRFKNLNINDLVEISVWQKGKGGEIVLSGKGKNCDPYYFTNKDIQLQDPGGWGKVQMIFSMFINCDSSTVDFFIQNPTGDTVYIDDLTFSVKKFR